MPLHFAIFCANNKPASGPPRSRPYSFWAPPIWDCASHPPVRAHPFAPLPIWALTGFYTAPSTYKYVASVNLSINRNR